MYSGICAEIEPVRYGLDAICTVISDDGIPSTIDELYKMALKYRIKFTVAQAIMNISNLDRLRDMESGNDIEFISHSFSHLNMGPDGIPERVLYHEIVESKEYLEKYFTTSQIAFVPPNNQLSKAAYRICRKHFYAVRRWTRELNPLSPEPGEGPLQWLNLGCKGIGDVKTTQERNEWVDQCIGQKKWLIEMWHNVDKDVSKDYQTIHPIDAEDHIAYISQKRDEGHLWVASFVDATKYMLEKQTADVRICEINKNVWNVNLKSRISEMDLRFDMPLSIRIKLPDDAFCVMVQRNQKIVKHVKSEKGVWKVMLEMLPEEQITISAK